MAVISLSYYYLKNYTLFFIILAKCVCVYLGASGCGYVHVCAAVCQGRKSVSYCLDLELQAVVCFLMWVLGTKPKPSTSATKVLSPPPPSLLSSSHRDESTLCKLTCNNFGVLNALTNNI